MKAVVEISGQQYNVAEGDVIKAPLQDAEPGQELEFSKIFMTTNGEEVTLGAPTLDGNVKVEVVEHGRDPKILIFHKKRRKGYRKLNGHRQHFSVVKIKSISIN
ncbi:50S ribosomal protein L21 [Candidatus Kapabacteria bacterium]|nr:50S ribosomal protein L21 [Candidatus Kapabacteria bacterium]